MWTVLEESTSNNDLKLLVPYHHYVPMPPHFFPFLIHISV